ncbi:MAG: S41 family peptidase [Bacteroidota bacterium]
MSYYEHNYNYRGFIDMNSKIIFIPMLLLFLLSSCNEESEEPRSVEVESFINEVVDIMETNSINRQSIDWEDFRAQVQASAAGARNTNGTSDALRLALRLLGDNHSFIFWQGGGILSEAVLDCDPVSYAVVNTPDNIGYIRVPFFTGNDKAETEAFAQGLQNQIRNADSENTIGWIVDLRGNTGGNMWPMLAGIGPILGEGIAGYFISPDDVETEWSYANGASLIEEEVQVQVSNPYELINPDVKVAVLQDRAVSSSGEAIAIAFRGKSNAQSFGSLTCGIATSNSVFPLSDGSTLILTTAFMADRNKSKYGNPVEPEQPTSQAVIVELAIDFIEN